MDTVLHPPTGTVTLLLADLEASTALWDFHDAAMRTAMAGVQVIVETATAAHGGYRPLEQGEGDSFVIAFSRATDAVRCALELQWRFATTDGESDVPIRFRIGLHTGEVEVSDTGRYDGTTVSRCARIRDLGHGGQTLVSAMTVGLLAGQAPDGAVFDRLGQCRLRGITDPVEIHQLTHPDLDQDFPPIRNDRSTNIGPSPDRFVGREAEVAAVVELLDATRLLTITGAGGSGKSRLAVEVARNSVDHDSVWLVELAAVRDGALVERVVLDAVSASPGRAGTELRQIAAKIADRPSLLVLDNCEHLLDVTAGLAATLLQRCPQLTIIGTSREPLGLHGEIQYGIPSLESAAAAELFLDRARRANPSTDLDADRDAVAAIVQRLDGLPLALELAASRTRFLSVSAIADGLDDRFRLLTGGARDALSRQRTLEASVDWSYDLLGATDRVVLRRLSVFAGSFTIAAAEPVCAGDGVSADEVFETICRLVDRSLVQAEATDHGSGIRYRLLETIRAYAAQRLVEAEDPAETRNRHLDHVRAFAEHAGLGHALDSQRWNDRIRDELDDIRAALDWAQETDRPDDVLAIISSLSTFWMVRSMFAETFARVRDATFTPSRSTAPDRRALALAVAGSQATYAGDGEAGYEAACEAVELADGAESAEATIRAASRVFRAWTGMFAMRSTTEEILADVELAIELVEGETSDAAVFTLLHAGVVYLNMKSVARARTLLEQAISTSASTGAGWSAAMSCRVFLTQCGTDGEIEASRGYASEVIAFAEGIGADAVLSFTLAEEQLMESFYGDETRARRSGTRALEVARRSGLRMQEQLALMSIAAVELRFGDPTDALDAAQANLAAAQHTIAVSDAIGRWLLGAAARRAGETDVARRELECACDLTSNLILPMVTGHARLQLALLALEEGEPHEAWDQAHDALAGFDGFDDLLGSLDALDVIAVVASRTGNISLAARVLGATDRLRSDLGVAPFAVESSTRDAAVANVRAALPRDDFESATRQGAELTAEEAVRLVQRGRGDRRRPDSGWASLTPSEVEVVRHLRLGMSNAEIAEKLFVTTNTVKTHLKHIYNKLGTSSRAEVAADATRRGIG